jgi:riboflavin synthase
MFTGIVEQIGQGERISENHFWVSHAYTEDFCIGESVALSGMCSTVIEIQEGKFLVEIMEESRKKTIFGSKEKAEIFPVNLERAARMDQRNSGHLIQGHVDGLGEIVERRRVGDYELFIIKYPKKFRDLLIMKGSVAVDGISLTVSGLDDPEEDNAFFEVSIIGHTLEVTVLGQKQVEDLCHLEFDMTLKYANRKKSLKNLDNNFERWNRVKQQIHNSKKAPFFREGEIRWVVWGQNIGSEIFGKGEFFRRPVLIVKRVFGASAIVIPLSSGVAKKGQHFFVFEDVKGNARTALLAQIRYIDGCRICEKESAIPPSVLDDIKKVIKTSL